MADFHKSLNAARKKVSGVVSLRELGWRRESRSFLSTGISQLDELLGGEGLPVGRMSEFYGPASAGKTSLVSGIMAGVTARGGCVAYVDFFNSLSPEFLRAAGADLENILWVRGPGARRPEKDIGQDDLDYGNDPDPDGRAVIILRRALKQAEILVKSGNFTLVVLDLAESSSVRGGGAAGSGGMLLPKSAWFRLQRAAEKSKSVLILLSGRRTTSGASARVLALQGGKGLWGGEPVRPGKDVSCPHNLGNREKRALLLGMKASLSVMKGGRNGRSIIFHCHL